MENFEKIGKEEGDMLDKRENNLEYDNNNDNNNLTNQEENNTIKNANTYEEEELFKEV